MVDMLTDLEVINGVLMGDTGLFEILLRRNNQKLYRIIKGYLRIEDYVEDVMQETYLKAYLNLKGIPSFLPG